MLTAIFNMDNPFWSTINKIIDLVCLSLLWALCCLPVVTAGSACAALYYAVVKAVRRQRSYSGKEFWRAFRINLKKGSLIHLVWLILGLMMLTSDVPMLLALLVEGRNQNIPFSLLLALKILFLLGIFCWIYPLLSRYEERVWKLGEAALYLMLRYFPRTLLAIFLLTLALVMLWIEPLLLVIVPGVAALSLSFLLEPILCQICKERPREGEDAWYLES